MGRPVGWAERPRCVVRVTWGELAMMATLTPDGSIVFDKHPAKVCAILGVPRATQVLESCEAGMQPELVPVAPGEVP